MSLPVDVEGAPTTGGWTDEQIRGKSLEEIDQLIEMNDLALDAQRTVVFTQEEVVTNLRRVRARKIKLGE
jgi:hypothetical protein